MFVWVMFAKLASARSKATIFVSVSDANRGVTPKAMSGAAIYASVGHIPAAEQCC